MPSGPRTAWPAPPSTAIGAIWKGWRAGWMGATVAWPASSVPGCSTTWPGAPTMAGRRAAMRACCRRCVRSSPMAYAVANAVKTPARCWTHRNCHVCCPRRWPKARSMHCWRRRTSTAHWACATGPCSN
ncbi:hypothetical protein G6F68_011811 [Rhizopus microsporus]|nr:hypothetical protein G6F68_011811 [Rhizopus microsporus]